MFFLSRLKLSEAYAKNCWSKSVLKKILLGWLGLPKPPAPEQAPEKKKFLTYVGRGKKDEREDGKCGPKIAWDFEIK